MATFVKYNCNHCGMDYNLSGPHEFYRNDIHEVIRFGHPVPRSLEAKKAGVFGLYNEMFCFNCKKIVNVIALELETPIEGDKYSYIWIAWKDEEKYPRKEIQIECPDCKSKDVSSDLTSINCPICDEGNLGSPIFLATS